MSLIVALAAVDDSLPGGLDPVLFALALPLVLGLVQLAKEVGLSSRWAGVAALALGVACGLLLPFASVGDAPPARAALTGLVAGLSAAGAWSTGKALVQTSTGHGGAGGDADMVMGVGMELDVQPGTRTPTDLRRT